MFLSRSGGFLLLIAVLALLVSACGGGEEATTPVSPTATALLATPRLATPVSAGPTAAPTVVPASPVVVPTEQPKYGGILQGRTLRGDVMIPDLYDLRGGAFIPYLVPMFSNLTWIDPYNEAEVVPDLAESWTVEGGGTAIAFKLRPGVTWHDGRPLSAADVVYTYNRAINPPSATITSNAGIFASVAKVVASDSSTVVVTMKQPSASFLRGIASNTVPIMPQHQTIEEFNQKPLGTGAFKFAGQRAGIDMQMVKNDNYWRKDSRGNRLPYLDGRTIYVIPDDATAQSAFRSGRIDLLSPFDSGAAWPLLRDGTLQKEIPGLVHGVAFGTVSYLYFNQVTPFTDIRVRKAFHLALDRHTLADAGVIDVPAYPWTSPLITPELGGLWGIPESELAPEPGFRKEKTADTAQAKRLLLEAGVDPTKLTLRLIVSGRIAAHGAQAAADILRQTLGLNVSLRELSSADNRQTLARGDFDASFASAVPTFDDPSTYLTGVVGTGGSLNYGKWSDAQIDSLLQRQEAALDVAARRQLLLELQRRVIDSAFAVPVWYIRNGWAYRPYLKNQPPWSITFGPQWRFDQVWLDR